MNVRLCCALLVVAVPLTAAAQKAPTADRLSIEDTAAGFKLVLPKGAQVVPGAATAEIPYVYAIGTGPEALTIGIQLMGGRIPRTLSESDAAKIKAKLPAGASLVPGEWQGIKLMVMRVEQQNGQTLFVDYGAQVPLARQAINIHIAGSQKIEDRVKKTLAELLSALTGEAAK